ncbi:uncharacterized protein LOC134842412 isoform X2 [Symsagittifera roscoffensis]
MYPGAKNAGNCDTSWISANTYVTEEGHPYTIIDTPPITHQSLGNDLITFLKQYQYEKIDAVCIVQPGNKAEIPSYDMSVMKQVTSLFERNAIGNIFLISTFGLHRESSISGLEFERQISLENSCLFTQNETSRAMWELSFTNYEAFVDYISKSGKPAVRLVENEWKMDPKEIENAILSLEEAIQKLLYDSANLNREKEQLAAMKDDINTLQNLEYNVVVQKKEKVNKPQGLFVTVCLHCSQTCHDNCSFENDEDKHQCVAMDSNEPAESRHCKNCSEKCHWRKHSNTPYFYRVVEETVCKPIEGLLDLYSIRADDIRRGEKVVAHLEKTVTETLIQMVQQIEIIERNIRYMEQFDITNAADAKNRADRKRRSYIEKLKDKEEYENQAGSKERINQLEKAQLGEQYLKAVIEQMEA